LSATKLLDVRRMPETRLFDFFTSCFEFPSTIAMQYTMLHYLSSPIFEYLVGEARKMVREALEDTLMPSAKQRKELDKGPVKEGTLEDDATTERREIIIISAQMKLACELDCD
jgi:hypothetical protein